MAKISQIKLTSTTYDIDVASNLKATKIIGEDPIKIPPVEAIQKPDGVNPLFDENNKISSHYISDTILGQLKFGGAIDEASQTNEYKISYKITPGSHLISKISELVEYAAAETAIVRLEKDFVTARLDIVCHKGDNAYITNVNDVGSAFDGFYFISNCNHDGYKVHVSAPTINVGDWVVVAGSSLQKIDNTDTITHIDETAGTSLLEITGSSGLKLNGFTDDDQRIKFDKPLTYEDGAGNKLTLGGTGVNGLYFSRTDGEQSYINYDSIKIPNINASTVGASTKMTAPTITNKTDRSQVVNLEYFEDNSSKVDWEHIDSEVHVINDHSVEIDGGLVVHGKTDDNILEVSENNIETDITEQLQAISFEKEPKYVDGAWTWDTSSTALENYTGPYWATFPVIAGNTYIIEPKDDMIQSGQGIDYVVLKIADTENLVAVNWAHSPNYGATFTATQDGIAYIGCGGWSMGPYAVSTRVLISSGSSVKINGDLEVTGDLSFGAESHLVFGTIEGTDFIADYAKVKNAPVEADDVVNKAYFDANKGSGEGGCVETVAVKASEGLVYELTGDEYSCTGIGTCTDTDIVIAAVHNGLPVTSIGDSAFFSCYSLTSITIPDSMTSIGEHAFELCTSLKSVVIGDGVTSIGDSAFSECYALTSVTIPDSVTSFGEYAFDDCSSLKSITIPDSVTSIGDYAFYYCENLTIYCEADSKPEGWHENWNPSNRPVVWGAALSIPAINDKLNNSGNSDISNYQGNAKINGDLEITGNLKFDGDLEMSSIEAQSIKINGKRVLTEDDLANLVAAAYKNANEEVY